MPAPAVDVVTRLFSASAERPAGPGVAERTRWGSDGYRLSLPYVGRGMSAYVRVVDAPGGSRVVGEVRPSRWTQVLIPLWVLVMVVRFVPGGGVERLLFGVGGVVLVGVVMHGSGNRVAAVRDWLERTVRGG